MFYENSSKYGFSETVDMLFEIIIEGGWKVIQVLDLQEIMKKNGKEILPVKVLEICKPDYGYRILSDDELRIYSNMLPCRISVYEKADGKVYISRMNVEFLSSKIGGVAQEIMSLAFTDAENFIKKISND